MTTPPGTEAIGRVIRRVNSRFLLLLDEVLNFVNRHRGMGEPCSPSCKTSSPRRHDHRRGGDQPAAQPGRDDRLGQAVARQDHQGRRRVAAADRQRRGRNRRGGTAAPVREPRRERTGRGSPGNMPIGASSAAHASRRNGRRSIPRPTRPRRGSFSRPGSRLATRSIRPRCRCSSASGGRFRNSSRRAARWRCWRSGFPRRSSTATRARSEPLITLGSAPLHIPEFRTVVLGQLGETRLIAAIDADIAGEPSHARALDADTKGALRDIHRRVGTAILFESSGGQIDKVAHLPELRFALGEPPTWIPPRSTPRRSRWRRRASSFARSERTGSGLPQGQDRQGRPTTAGHPYTPQRSP